MTPTNPLTTVTPLSKYLAMALFIAMPFIGGWIGYTHVPPTVVEIEKVNNQESAINYDPLSAETKNWGLCEPRSTVTKISRTGRERERLQLGFEEVDGTWNRLFVPFYGYDISGYCMKYPNNWSIALAGVENLNVAFNRDSNSTTTPEFFFQTIQSSLPLEDSDKEVYRYEYASSPLVGSKEMVVSRQTRQIGYKEALELVTKEGDVFYFRLFVKNENTLHVLSKSFTSNEYGTSVYADFLATADEMIFSLQPLGRY
jgi:hypothetical protein